MWSPFGELFDAHVGLGKALALMPREREMIPKHFEQTLMAETKAVLQAVFSFGRCPAPASAIHSLNFQYPLKITPIVLPYITLR